MGKIPEIEHVFHKQVRDTLMSGVFLMCAAVVEDKGVYLSGVH